VGSHPCGGREAGGHPAQHFSGRGLNDRNSTLWASFVIEQRDCASSSAATAAISGFKEIGQKYGPFDLTMVETGAYDPQWPDVHMQPAESLQAHLDLRGKVMLPIHNGTFDLALHAWHDPFDRITELAVAHGGRWRHRPGQRRYCTAGARGSMVGSRQAAGRAGH
jgi:L-ascorbate metabolism protein UlaG (beta-lactamase superfamily)